MSALITREQLAEALSWSSGEMTRFSESAHPDHNRWSWRGDGHDAAFRQQFWDQADALLAAGVFVDAGKLAEDDALVERVNRADGRPLFAGRAPDEVRSVLSNLAAVLASPQSERAEVESDA